MIKKFRKALGLMVHISELETRPGVIGEVGRTKTGNTFVRFGKVTVAEPETDQFSWEQNEYVVLAPEELDDLIETLVSHQEYKTIKVGDVVGMGAVVLAVHYANGSSGGNGRIGTVLAWDDHKREYIVWTADPYGNVDNGTYRKDQQRALNAYVARLNDHLFRHFNTTPPHITYADVARSDRLTATS